MVVHTSGSADMEVLEGASSNYGVIYPLQTFTFRRMLTLRDVPLCISANSMENIVRLKSFAYSLSNNVNIVTTEQRRALHLAAVYANNFANFMVTVAQDLLLDNGIDPGMLVPLIKQTAFNTAAGYAFKMQTGPAIREDMDTLSLHLDMLSSHPEYREIYELITKNIIQHKKEL